MKAIVVDGDALRWQTVADPELTTGTVRIRVHATALNRADLVQRAGGYPPPPGASPVLGLECAGEIIEVAEEASTWRVGDRVCALLAGGGYAEQVVVPAGQVLPIPEGLDFAEAASLPEVFATAYLNLFMEAKLERGECAVIHAGASGVGTAGVQLCSALGSRAFVTASGDDKIARCIELGAEGGWDRSRGDFTTAVGEWTEGSGADVILDPVGGAYLQSNVASLATDGRLVLIGLLDGVTAELPLATVLMRRLRIIGSTLRARSISAKSEIMDQLHTHVWPHIANGRIRPVIADQFAIQAADSAHALLAANATVGKVVLNVPV